jgi:DNA polymerase
MTAAEKTELARFLDLAFDTLHGRYGAGEKEYNFSDDEPATQATGGITDDITAIAAEIHKCAACPLCRIRTQAVPGAGVQKPLVMVIGGGPGIEDDSTGRPFAGATGEHLDQMLSSIGLSRDTNCYVTGIVKCRTPDTRDPLPEETTACADFLHRQILALTPRIILCIGKIAAQSLLRTNGEIETLREKDNKVRVADTVIPVVVTYHPDDLWKDVALKRPAWEDLKALRARLGAYAAVDN